MSAAPLPVHRDPRLLAIAGVSRRRLARVWASRASRSPRTAVSLSSSSRHVCVLISAPLFIWRGVTAIGVDTRSAQQQLPDRPDGDLPLSSRACPPRPRSPAVPFPKPGRHAAADQWRAIVRTRFNALTSIVIGFRARPTPTTGNACDPVRRRKKEIRLNRMSARRQLIPARWRGPVFIIWKRSRRQSPAAFLPVASRVDCQRLMRTHPLTDAAYRRDARVYFAGTYAVVPVPLLMTPSHA